MRSLFCCSLNQLLCCIITSCAACRPLLAGSPFVDLGFDWFGFVKPLSAWPVTNYGDLSGLPDPTLNKMANFTSPVLLVSGTADAYHTVTSMQKAMGDITSFNVRQSLMNPTQPSVPLYSVAVQNAGSFVFFFSAYCINQFLSSSPQLTISCQTNVPINWNFGAGEVCVCVRVCVRV